MAQFHLSESDFESDSMESLSEHSTTYLTSLSKTRGGNGIIGGTGNNNGNGGMEMQKIM